MSQWREFQAKKVAAVSHDYNLHNSYGHQDYAEHHSQIIKVCDDNGCDTILYSLFTWDEKSPIPRNQETVFAGLSNVKCVILEVGNKKSARKIVEVWMKNEEQPRTLEQYFAKSLDPYELKREFIRDARKRVVGNGMIVICGESNIANHVPRDGSFKDPFGFNDLLKSFGIKYIFNPLHDYMTRYEMKRKRCFYSRDKRAVVTVWNQGKRKGEAQIPWTFFYDNEDLTASVIEVSPIIAERPDIRIGIMPVIS